MPVQRPLFPPSPGSPTRVSTPGATDTSRHQVDVATPPQQLKATDLDSMTTPAFRARQAAANPQVGLPASMYCPISLALMRDPVVVSTGQIFERDAITRYLDDTSRVSWPCPLTQQPLERDIVIGVPSLRTAIVEALEQLWRTYPETARQLEVPTLTAYRAQTPTRGLDTDRYYGPFAGSAAASDGSPVLYSAPQDPLRSPTMTSTMLENGAWSANIRQSPPASPHASDSDFDLDALEREVDALQAHLDGSGAENTSPLSERPRAPLRIGPVPRHGRGST